MSTSKLSPTISTDAAYEEALQAILMSNRSSRDEPPSLTAIQRLNHVLETEPPHTWTRVMVERLVSALGSALLSGHDAKTQQQHQVTTAAMQVLVRAMDIWTDNVTCISLLLPIENNKNGTLSLLHVLFQWVVDSDNNEMKQSHYAMVAVSKWWQANERIQSRCTASLYSSSTLNHAGGMGDPTTMPMWINGQLNHSQEEQLALLAIKLLTATTTEEHMTVEQEGPHLEIRLACTTILSGLLRYNVSGWLLRPRPPNTQEQQQQNNGGGGGVVSDELCRCLLMEAHQLNDNTTRSASATLCLASLSLLCLIQWRCPQPIPDLDAFFGSSTNIVEHVVRVAFPTRLSTPRGPRWTYEAKRDDDNTCTRLLRQGALNVVQSWSLVPQGDVWLAFLSKERHWLTFVEETWHCVLTQGDPNNNNTAVRLEHSLPALHFLHTTCRALVHDTLLAMLTSTLPAEQTCQQLLMSLASLCRHDNFTVATSSAALLKALLCQQQNVNTHDELSRLIWKTIETSTVIPSRNHPNISGGCASSFDAYIMDLVLTLSTTHHAACESPRLVCLLDVLELLVSSCLVCCERMILLPTQDDSTEMHETVQKKVDALVEIMSPASNASREQRNLVSGMRDNETPKMSNLVSLQEPKMAKDKNAADPKTEEKATRMIDLTVSITAATVLGRLGYIDCQNSSSDMADDEAAIDRLCLRQANIRSAVTNFVLNLPSCLLQTSAPPCRDLTRRLLRLYALLATSSGDGEELASSVLYATDMIRSRESHCRIEELSSCQQELRDMTSRAQRLTVERDGYRAELESKALVYNREIQRVHLQASSEAARLVERHVAERSAAEDRALEFAKRTAQAEAIQQEAENQAESARACEDLMRSELGIATSKMKELETSLQAQKHAAEETEIRAAQVSQELNQVKYQLNSVVGEHKDAERELSATKDKLCEADSFCKQLHDDLEDTYSTLVQLAHVYQAKEKEMSNMKDECDKAVAEAKKKTKEERLLNDTLEENEQRLKRENEKLAKKLVRAKEKLEEERRERRAEELARRKRYGPVSYINQLHDDSMVSEKSSSRARDRSRIHYSGKENDYPRSSSARRREYR